MKFKAMNGYANDNSNLLSAAIQVNDAIKAAAKPEKTYGSINKRTIISNLASKPADGNSKLTLVNRHFNINWPKAVNIKVKNIYKYPVTIIPYVYSRVDRLKNAFTFYGLDIQEIQIPFFACDEIHLAGKPK